MVQDVNSISHDTSALATVLLAIKALSLLKNIPVGHDACSEKLPNGLTNEMVHPLYKLSLLTVYMEFLVHVYGLNYGMLVLFHCFISDSFKFEKC